MTQRQSRDIIAPSPMVGHPDPLLQCFSEKPSGLWWGFLAGPIHVFRALYNIADSPDWLFTKEGFMLDPID